MKPNKCTGDFVITNKLSYVWNIQKYVYSALYTRYLASAYNHTTLHLCNVPVIIVYT